MSENTKVAIAVTAIILGILAFVSPLAYLGIQIHLQEVATTKYYHTPNEVKIHSKTVVNKSRGGVLGCEWSEYLLIDARGNSYRVTPGIYSIALPGDTYILSGNSHYQFNHAERK